MGPKFKILYLLFNLFGFFCYYQLLFLHKISCLVAGRSVYVFDWSHARLGNPAVTYQVHKHIPSPCDLA